MTGTEGGVRHRRQMRENQNENDAAVVITVLTALAGSAGGAAEPAAASLWSAPSYRLQAAALTPGPSAWWASGLPR